MEISLDVFTAATEEMEEEGSAARRLLIFSARMI